ncbi:MAG: PD-(D/E)XK motif protein [Crocinitomicaceae bacterium]|nr:PD-(D/E)XK motif protein [Crocinitomicaceae bacterium]
MTSKLKQGHFSGRSEISSEFQLEANFDKQMELIVVSVQFDAENGISLKDLLLTVKNSILELFGDASILLKAISQKGLSLKNVHLYDNFRFKPVNIVSYNCSINSFPELVKSNIPKEISSINYNLRLSKLSDFIISKITF